MVGVQIRQHAFLRELPICLIYDHRNTGERLRNFTQLGIAYKMPGWIVRIGEQHHIHMMLPPKFYKIRNAEGTILLTWKFHNLTLMHGCIIIIHGEVRRQGQ